MERREEKLKKKERSLEDEMGRRERLESELESIRKEHSLLQQVNRRQEQALAKKDKQLQDQTDELDQVRQIQEQIFNLSKLKNKN